MSATSIQTKQGRTRKPGVYSETIPVGVPLATPGGKGLLLIGEAEGGEPGVIHTITRPSQARELLRAGDLLNAALMSFDPSRSAKITGRPQHVHLYKVNPAVRASGVLTNGQGDAIDVVARDWGAFGNRIGLDVELGTNKGRKLVVSLDDTTESADDLGGDLAFDARYDPAGEASSMILSAGPDGIELAYTLPLDGQRITAMAGNDTLKVASANAYDNFQVVTLFGVDAANAPISETVNLNGVAEVTAAVPATFAALTGVRVSGAHRGIITVSTDADQDLTTLAAVLAAAVVGPFNVISTDNDDTVNVLIVGKVANGNTVQEVIKLAGTTAVDGAVPFTKLISARVIGTTAGTVSIRQVSDDTVGATIAAGTNGSVGIDVRKGIYQPASMAFDSVISTILDAAQVGAQIVVRGVNRAGTVVAERRTVSDASANTVNDFVRVNQIEIGGIDNARTLTLTGTAASSTAAARPLLRDAVAFLAGLPGFQASSYRPAAFAVADLDSASGEIVGADAAGFYADLYDMLTWINGASEIITASRSTDATNAPDPTGARVYLVGGSEGTTPATAWDAALLAGRALSADPAFESSRLIIVPLTDDLAVINTLVGHVGYMDGRHERIGYVGLADTLNKAAVKAAVRAINARQIGVFASRPVVYGADGAEVELPAWGWAVLAAAMQAGSPVATPLTEAEGNVLRSVTHASWDPVADIEEMIAAGLIVPQGRRIVRSVSSHLTDDNPFYTEVSTNDSLDTSAFNMRRALRPKIGDKNFDGAASTVRTLAIVELQRQVRDGEIKSFNVESVEAVDFGDGFDVDYEVEPIEPINFIRVRAFAQRLSVRV